MTMTSIFPTIRPGLSGPLVSRKLLNRGKKESIEVLTKNKKYIEVVFSKVINDTCSFNLKQAIYLINNAVLYPTDTYFGWCDGKTLYIGNGKMHYKNIVGTLIHEALHGTVTSHGKELTEDQEHDAMELLGDWYARGGAKGL